MQDKALEKLWDKAVRLQEKGKYPEAEAAFRELLRQAPELEEAWLDLAALLLRMERDREAWECYAQAAARAEDEVAAACEWADALLEEERFEEAARLIGEVAARHPESPDAQRARVLTLLEAGKDEEAEAACKGLISRNPSREDAFPWAAMLADVAELVEETTGDAAVVSRLRERAAELGPTEDEIIELEKAEYQASLGILLLEATGNQDSAEWMAPFKGWLASPATAVAAASALDAPELAGVYLDLVQGEIDSVREEAQAALLRRPGFAAAYDLLGRVAAISGEYPAAIACFRDLVKRRPDYEPGRLCLAWAYFEAHKWGDLRKFLRNK
jgi:tetratricopeptide (TPR) repeat protein